VLRQEFVVGGFTDPERSREGVGALLVGYYENDRLQWAGKVGTGAGWTVSFLRDLRQRLNGLETSDSPFDPPVSDSGLRRSAHWVRPELVVEVAFIEWTDDGRIRHPSVQGLRPDRAPREVRREKPIRDADAPRPPETPAIRRTQKSRKARKRSG
jgi:bifunctional non-homologous end joining protein LigD